MKSALLIFRPSMQLNAQCMVKKAHSRNDYTNSVLFWTTYNAHLGSIEADVFAVYGELIVAYDKGETSKGLTLNNLYIKSLASYYRQNRNKPWPDGDYRLQLFAILKNPPSPAFDLLVAKLKQYPEVFYRAGNHLRLSGNCYRRYTQTVRLRRISAVRHVRRQPVRNLYFPTT